MTPLQVIVLLLVIGLLRGIYKASQELSLGGNFIAAILCFVQTLLGWGTLEISNLFYNSFSEAKHKDDNIIGVRTKTLPEHQKPKSNHGFYRVAGFVFFILIMAMLITAAQKGFI